MARRDNSDPGEAGVYPKWAWSWPVNRRILYNRASADMNGNPWDPSRKLLWWDGSKWTGYDVPDIAPTAKPDVVGPFIMNPEGTARLFSAWPDARRTVPGALRALRVAGGERAGAEGARQSGVAHLQGRPGAVRRRQGVSLCGDLLSAHRAFPLLDQARRGERLAAAGVLRRNFASNWRRRRASKKAAGSVSGRSAARSRRRPWSPSASGR